MSLLDNVQQSVEQMSEAELREAFLQMEQEKKARTEKQKKYNLDPANKEKRLAYSKERNEKIKQDPEKYAVVQAKRKEYMAKNKDKQKAYRTKRNELHKAIMQRARELGIDKQVTA